MLIVPRRVGGLEKLPGVAAGESFSDPPCRWFGDEKAFAISNIMCDPPCRRLGEYNRIVLETIGSDPPCRRLGGYNRSKLFDI